MRSFTRFRLHREHESYTSTSYTCAMPVRSLVNTMRRPSGETLGCGCVTGHYREVATSREVTYVEEKGLNCEHSSHRRNHTVASARAEFVSLAARAS